MRRLAAALLLTGSVVAHALPAGAVDGTASYSVDMPTPPGAVFEAVLSGVDETGERRILIRQRDVNVSSTPFEIALPYPGEAADLRVHATLRLPNGRLLLSGAAAVGDGPVEVMMQREETETRALGLIGPQWRLFRLGEETVAPIEGERALPYLVFGPAGQLGGVASCNRVSAGYTLSPEGVLAIAQVAATRMACSEPVMARERAVLDLLAAVEQVAIEGDRLTLIGGGVPLAMLVAEPDISVE
jgi:heat shock protein HslJ